MKLLSRLLSKSALVCAGIALLTLAQTAGAAPQQGTAVARSVSGTAEYSTGGAWAPLKSGTELAAGTTIRTAADGEVSLGLGENGKAIVVAPSSILTIDKLTFEKTGADTVTETQLDLKAGRIVGDVNKTSAASRFEIKTPTGVAGIRGTKFDISANGVVKVKNGCVVVVYVSPTGQVSSYEVCGGFKFVPGVGVVPMTDEEIKSRDWDKFTGTAGSPGQTPRIVDLLPNGGPGILFVAPVSPKDYTNSYVSPTLPD
jgi:FecR protein